MNRNALEYGVHAAVMTVVVMLCASLLIPTAHAQSQTAKKPAKPATSPATPSPAPAKKPAVTKSSSPKPAAASTKADQQLSALADTLRDRPTATAEQNLANFAQTHAKDEYGAYAALALGHYYLDRSHLPDALKWLGVALQRSSRLDEYSLFWHAQTLRQLGRNDEALAELGSFRHKYPDSVMSDLAVQSYAEGAIAQGNAQGAAAMLDAYAKTSQKPVLLLLRAQAREKDGSKIAAAKDYAALYYGFPLSDEARAAGQRIPQLGRELGDSFPNPPLAQQTARAEALYGAHRWREALVEFDATLAQTAGADYAHAQLRIAQCRAAEGSSASALVAVKLTDPEAEAERLYSLSQAYRTEKREPEMLEAITQAATRFPQSSWTAEALFAGGNYYWVALDRARAADFYRRSVDAFPAGKNAPVAAWRAAWTSYLDRKPEAGGLLESYIQTYPTSTMVPDALYWLGRAAEKNGNVAHARSFYIKDAQRFPQTFFGLRAGGRLAEIGTQPLNPAEFLSVIPDAPVAGQFDAPIPPEAEVRWQRAQALHLIGFEASAELELRAAYSSTQSPRLLLEAAREAIAAEHFSVGISLARLAYPQPESHRPGDIPEDVAKVLYPLPYYSSVANAAAQHKVDPMLVVGVMRQESAFQSDAVSRAGAVGLMQVLPKTAPALARHLKLRYARARLFDPDYNLQLGTLYLSQLLGQFSNPETALAAYNAGEDRAKLWQAERNYDEVAEFVESIPFTETRDYVQIILRNAAIYHLLNPGPVAAATPTRPAASKAAARKSSAAKRGASKTRATGSLR